MKITKQNFMAGCRCLIDNGIEPDEAQTVMQALCYVMFDKETEQFMEDEVKCCQSCTKLDSVCESEYHLCTIHNLKHFSSEDDDE